MEKAWRCLVFAGYWRTFRPLKNVAAARGVLGGDQFHARCSLLFSPICQEREGSVEFVNIGCRHRGIISRGLRFRRYGEVKIEALGEVDEAEGDYASIAVVRVMSMMFLWLVCVPG